MAQAEESSNRNGGGLAPGVKLFARVLKGSWTTGLPFAFIIAGVVIFVVVFIVILNPDSDVGALSGTGGNGNGGVLIPPGQGGTGDISSCTFYRGGDSVQELKFGNSSLASLVSEVSSKIGVPPAVVAGIMRVESASDMAKTDPTYLLNDYDDTSSGVAYGLMQFTPGTFVNTFNRNSGELNSLFGKTQVREILDPPGNIYPSNYFRIYSIKDSIIATAFKVKNDKQSINGDGPWDQATVYEISRRYYGALHYGTNDQYNYGEDVWRSYTGCQTTTSTSTAKITCPLDPVGNSANISCGTYNNPKNSCGHGGTGYPVCTREIYAACPYTEQLKNAIDVIDKNGVGANIPIYLPVVNGASATWTFSGNENLGSIGWRQNYTTRSNNQTITLSLTHLNESDPLTTGSLLSGAKVATTRSAQAHLHVGVLINGVPVDPIKDLSMCTSN